MDTEKAYADRLKAQMRTADARLDEIRVEVERAAEGVLGQLVVFGPAQTFEHLVGEARAEPAVRERKVMVETYGVLEVLDGLVAVFGVERVEEELGEGGAPP